MPLAVIECTHCAFRLGLDIDDEQRANFSEVYGDDDPFPPDIGDATLLSCGCVLCHECLTEVAEDTGYVCWCGAHIFHDVCEFVNRVDEGHRVIEFGRASWFRCVLRLDHFFYTNGFVLKFALPSLGTLFRGSLADTPADLAETPAAPPPPEEVQVFCSSGRGWEAVTVVDPGPDSNLFLAVFAHEEENYWLIVDLFEIRRHEAYMTFAKCCHIHDAHRERRAAAVILRALTEANYRPGGPGFFKAREHFGELALSRSS